MFEACKTDDGIVGKLFDQAKQHITYYLETGESKGFSGHTLMWEAQKDFHRNNTQIRQFVNKHLTQEYCNLDLYMYSHLLEFQEAYTTDPNKLYPFQSNFGFNFYEYMNTIDDELVTCQNAYNIDMLEHVKDDEYYNRLYFRRRQGWGKSLITQIVSE